MRPPAPEQDPDVPAPVLLAGDDGVPLRVAEELSGAGVPTVSLCSSAGALAARGAAALVVGDWLDAGTWDRAGLARASAGALPSTIAAQRRARRPAPPESRHSPGARLRALAGAVPRRAEWLALAILVVFSASTTVFALSKHLDVVDSMYFTATTMATVGYGDVNLSTAPDWLKIYDIGLMAVSAVLLASVLAFVTDLLVRSRIDRALGRFPRPARDHVIVCGLGKAGAAIITGLRELGVPCVGVEQHADAVGIAVARQLEVPVVFADARTPGVLTDLRVDRARAVMAITDDDLANLQCGLTAREHNPDVRVVLRIFDPHLAERLDRNVELDLTRSVAGLAAPVFTAALLGRAGVAEPLALSSVPLRVLEATVPAGASFAGRTVGEAHHGRALRVLSLDGRWMPREDLVLEAGTHAAIVGTRAACDEFLAPVPSVRA